MKRVFEISPSSDTAGSSALIADLTATAPPVADARRAARASNDAAQETRVRAIDVLAACMADSTFGA